MKSLELTQPKNGPIQAFSASRRPTSYMGSPAASCDYFRQVILKTVQLFANNELGAWERAFSLVNFPRYQDILCDTGNDNEIGVYTDSVERLVTRIGLGDEQDIHAFMSAHSAVSHLPARAS